MREICCLYEAGGGTGVRPHVTRQELIDRLQTQHSLVILVTDSLTHYMEGVRNKLTGKHFIMSISLLPLPIYLFF
jgi:ubiquitin carboxyl-terminal hydrolase 9/24